MPIRVLITAGTTADCKQAVALIDWFTADYLLAERGYDTNELIDKATTDGIQIVIPPKKNRKDQRDHDKYLYKVRHLVDNTFLQLKHWRGVATRYAKTKPHLLPLYTYVALFCGWKF